MAAMGPDDNSGAQAGGTAVCPSGLQACISTNKQSVVSRERDGTPLKVYTQRCVQPEKPFLESAPPKNKSPASLTQRETDQCWSSLAVPLKAVGSTVHISNTAATGTGEAPYSFRSPDSVEMDEIMAAMVLTSLSCSPVVQSPPQADPGTGGSSSSADMECGGGELSDSGSSGYWSWDHGNVSPAPSPSVAEMDSSPDEGLHMELEQGDEHNAKKPKSSFRAVYKCLWPSCGKVLTSSVGIKRHIRVLHLGGSDQSQREEDFYYTKISCEPVEASSPAAPSQHALSQASSSHLSWASCTSPSASEIHISPAYRPRSNSSSGLVLSRPSPLSQSAPSSFWQIHSEHLYQACSPVQVQVASRSPGCQVWTPAAPVASHSNTPLVKPRCRSVSVGEQWLQQNRLQPISVSPSRNHCSFRKGRGEAKKCRKVYGIERKDQWCTACRWKKACQRFPD
ncbi:zinc finger protein 395b isoform X2 [Halichoeres trimaculatus]|uniref:zinc finger protein 395b isoform X2 n=1 Tax=Halichoeres trimaculatus TaxID=147232 RepID=UPI003D9F0CD8